MLLVVSVPAAFAASATMLGAVHSAPNPVIGYAAGGAAFGATTGAVLAGLLRQPAPKVASGMASAA